MDYHSHSITFKEAMELSQYHFRVLTHDADLSLLKIHILAVNVCHMSNEQINKVQPYILQYLRSSLHQDALILNKL
jgi:hypothetical protein